MKVRYVGESFGVDGLANGTVYTCLGIEDGGEFGSMLRIIDDSEEAYLYSALNPAPLDGRSLGGRWEIVEDDAFGSLAKVILN